MYLRQLLAQFARAMDAANQFLEAREAKTQSLYLFASRVRSFGCFTAPFSWDYDRKEILADGIIHAVSIIMAVCGAFVLTAVTTRAGNSVQIAAAVIYLIGLLAMFSLSAVYSLWPVSPFKWWLRRLDHSAIYLLIAATYTAFLLPIDGATPAATLAIVWTAALAGMLVKILWPGRLDRMSIVLCLAMGWSGVFAIGSIASLLPATLFLIAVGGVLYSVGVIFYLWNSLRFQHAIWHGFVLTGATCHYAALLTSLAR